jgi:hypothetical protein
MEGVSSEKEELNQCLSYFKIQKLSMKMFLNVRGVEEEITM